MCNVPPPPHPLVAEILMRVCCPPYTVKEMLPLCITPNPRVAAFPGAYL
jgi:hypothetical protein